MGLNWKKNCWILSFTTCFKLEEVKVEYVLKLVL